jgi:phytanoyl-CoA hydroxylase
MAAAALQPTPVPAHELVLDNSPKSLPKLRSNYGPYLDSSSVGLLNPTPADTPLEGMHRRFDRDGYLYIKHLIPRSDVLDVREEYFGHLAPMNILQTGTSPREGIFREGEDPVVHNGVGGRNRVDDLM